jgi:hypothetical protein
LDHEENPSLDTNSLSPSRESFLPPTGPEANLSVRLGLLSPSHWLNCSLNPSSSPNFTLTLLRTPHAPPHFASFLTPLNLNKLDLKDYLYHAYGLKVLNVRSYVIQAKVREDKPGAKIPGRNR